jgi:hypothetical protein
MIMLACLTKLAAWAFDFPLLHIIPIIVLQSKFILHG